MARRRQNNRRIIASVLMRLVLRLVLISLDFPNHISTKPFSSCHVRLNAAVIGTDYKGVCTIVFPLKEIHAREQNKISTF